MKKLLVIFAMIITMANAHAESLFCFYQSNVNFAMTGHVVSIVGSRFVFKGDNGELVTSSLANCYIKA